MLIDILEPMGAQFDRLRCEVCQNLFLSPMNTGFLRHAVATVLTVYGIETAKRAFCIRLKLAYVATVLTVYGIETINSLTSFRKNLNKLQQCLPFTVLKLTCIISFIISNSYRCNSAYRLRY